MAQCVVCEASWVVHLNSLIQNKLAWSITGIYGFYYLVCLNASNPPKLDKAFFLSLFSLFYMVKFSARLVVLNGVAMFI